MAKHSPVAAPEGAAASFEGTPRRNVLVSVLALAVGGVISLFPFASGLLVFLDPLLRKKSASAGEVPFRRVCPLAAVPGDGAPVKVALVADRVDAWTVDPQQPIGAVYLRRLPSADSKKGGSGKTRVQAFNAICPHAGCFVAWMPQDKVYLCPCHNSAFLPDGDNNTRFQGKTNPSPRPMDELAAEVRGDEVWVQFQNFHVGLHEKLPKG